MFGGVEYDPTKSTANAQKHGIDFDDAQSLWRDPDRVEIRARTDDEPRWLVVGRIAGSYSVVIRQLLGGDHVPGRTSQAHLRAPRDEGGGRNL